MGKTVGVRGVVSVADDVAGVKFGDVFENGGFEFAEFLKLWGEAGLKFGLLLNQQEGEGGK